MVSKQWLLNSYIYPFNKYWMRAYQHFNSSTKWWKALSCAQLHLASTLAWAQSKPGPQWVEGRCSKQGGGAAVGLHVKLTPGHRHPTSSSEPHCPEKPSCCSWGQCGLVDMGKGSGRQRRVSSFTVSRPGPCSICLWPMLEMKSICYTWHNMKSSESETKWEGSKTNIPIARDKMVWIWMGGKNADEINDRMWQFIFKC